MITCALIQYTVIFRALKIEKFCQMNEGDFSYCYSKHIDGGYLIELHQ